VAKPRLLPILLAVLAVELFGFLVLVLVIVIHNIANG
jgi:hypothetical protein